MGTDCIIGNKGKAADFGTSVEAAVRHKGWFVLTAPDQKRLTTEFEQMGPATRKQALEQLNSVADKFHSETEYGASKAVGIDLKKTLKELGDTLPGAAACVFEKVHDTMRVKPDNVVTKGLIGARRDFVDGAQDFAAKRRECLIEGNCPPGTTKPAPETSSE